VITLHLFNLLFLRWRSPKAVVIGTHISGWAFVTLIVIIGPLALETKSKGRYFGVAGYWCAHVNNSTHLMYLTSLQVLDKLKVSGRTNIARIPRRTHRIEALEKYLPADHTLQEFLSAGLCLILYTAALLRVRGNLQQIDGKWTLRWVNRGEGWKLSFGRDLIDSYMLQLAQRMIWYVVSRGKSVSFADYRVPQVPRKLAVADCLINFLTCSVNQIFYSIALIPIAVARLTEFGGRVVPFWVTILSAVIFNLSGLPFDQPCPAIIYPRK
jgi:hypothetical protein